MTPVSYPDNVLDLIEPFLRDSRAAAVTDQTVDLTYRELDTLTRRIAAALQRQGVELNEPVAVRARLSAGAIVAILGVLRAGARYVPVDAAFPIERQRQMLTLSGARLALVEPGIAPVAGGWRALDLWPVADESQPLPGTRRGPTAYTYFTSGSTGVPKAVTVPSPALAYSTAARRVYYGDGVGAFLLCSSISFDSSVAGIFWTLATGGRLVIPSDRPANLVAVARAAARYRPTHLLLVPSLYGVLLGSADPASFASLTTVVVAGETCSPALVARHLGVLGHANLYNEYGPTECTVWSTVHRCTETDARAATVPIGQPIPGTSVTIRCPDGRPAPAGERGELWIDGPGVADGTGSYRTGDLASVGADGLLRFHGRADDQVKLGGVRMELAEIEQSVTAHEQVLAAAVSGPRNVASRRELVAFVVPVHDTVNVGALRAFLRSRLPAAAVPGTFIVLNGLPTLPNGKLDRAALDRLRPRRVTGP